MHRLVPIATIITPATLSVGLASPPAQLMQVPSVAFSSLSLVTNMEALQYPTYEVYTYYGPSDAVIAITRTVGALGDLLHVDPPAQNSSWTLVFPGPSLSCSEEIDTDIRHQIETNIGEYIQACQRTS